jgi:hypothetical protein
LGSGSKNCPEVGFKFQKLPRTWVQVPKTAQKLGSSSKNCPGLGFKFQKLPRSWVQVPKPAQDGRVINS